MNSNNIAIVKYNFDLTETARIDCTKVCSSSSCCNYRGIFYRKDTDQLLIAENSNKKVYSSDSELTTLTELASFSSINGARGLTYLNGAIVVGSEKNQILTIQDGSLTLTPYDNICPSSGNWINSIYVYKMKYILVTCDYDKRVKILNLNLSQTGYYLSTPSGYNFGLTYDGKRLLATTSSSPSLNIFF